MCVITGAYVILIRNHDGPKKHVYPHVSTPNMFLITTFPRDTYPGAALVFFDLAQLRQNG